MTRGLLDANAIEPMATVGAESAIGSHDVPPSTLSQTPPLPTPISQ
jgi:hypothetical protein